MEVISANAIDYKQVQLSHPEYQFQMVPPNTNGQEIILGSSRSPVQFTIPDNVFNWYTSNLSYNIKIPAGGANQYIWYALQPLKEISQMEFYGANGGQWAVNIDNFQNYLDIILKKESSLEDFLTYDQLTGMSRNNSVVNVVPALRNSTTAGVNTPDGPAYPSSINYEEPGYFKVTPVANQELTYEVQFPLGLIKNSLFAVNKDLYYAGLTYLRINFGPITKVCYLSTSNNNPSAGTKVTYPLATARIENLKLMLAIEKNESIARNVINQVMTNGIRLLIPYVLTFKNTGNSQTQNINIPLDAGQGITLMKVIHALYNQTEDVDLAYDHANTALNQKIFEYYTSFKSTRLQQLNLVCDDTGPYLDYMQHKDKLKGSVLSNMDVYKYSWFHCDDFCNFENKYMFDDGSFSMIAGAPLTNISTNWTFNGVRIKNQSFNHYTYCIVTKMMKLTATGLEVST